MKRRAILSAVGAGIAGAAAWRLWPDDGWWSECLAGPTPSDLLDHSLLRSVWDGIDPAAVWDCHVHLVGTGDGGGGAYVNPDTASLRHPVQYAQRRFYENAGCAEAPHEKDRAFVQRMLALHADFPRGTRIVLLAFDYFHDERGRADPARSAFHCPNEYARSVANSRPQVFEWIASVHPYREDALEALAEAARGGARGVKWLPSAMGMDPGSPRCDTFYEAMARLGLPLLTHAGSELAVHAGRAQALNNPLRLRRALERGVRVIVAHCATLGRGTDLDRGPDGPEVSNFALFARLMDERELEGRLYGEISALTQVNRAGAPLREIVRRRRWHPRLVNGSDYPLPGVMPLFSARALARDGLLSMEDAATLSALRRYNPLLFDFALKRTLSVDGVRLAPQVFESRRAFLALPL